MTSNDVYVVFVVGLIVLAATLVGAARRAVPPKFRFPQLGSRHLSTMLAWFMIAVSVLIVLARQK